MPKDREELVVDNDPHRDPIPYDNAALDRLIDAMIDPQAFEEELQVQRLRTWLWEHGAAGFEERRAHE